MIAGIGVVERPLRQVAHIRRRGRVGDVLTAICLVAAGSAAVITPWLLPSLAPERPNPQQRAARADRQASVAKGLPAIESRPIPAAPNLAEPIPASPAEPVAEDEIATVAPPQATLAVEDGIGASPSTGTAAVSPAPPAVASQAIPAIDDTSAGSPGTAASPDPGPQPASLITGSLAPPHSSLRTDTERETRHRSHALPLPRAFKPSAEREPLRTLPQRRAALPEPGRSLLQTRSPGVAPRISVRGQAGARSLPPAAPKAVVLPNSLLPFGIN